MHVLFQFITNDKLIFVSSEFCFNVFFCQLFDGIKNATAILKTYMCYTILLNFLGVYGNLKSLRLCGVFDYLGGHFKDENEEKYLLHDRFATDLPEMQTLAVYDNGRFVYWRCIIYFLRCLRVESFTH